MTLKTCVGRPGSNPMGVNKFLYTCFDYAISCVYNLYNISLIIVNKLPKWEGIFNWKSIEIISNHLLKFHIAIFTNI
jgi:hypothetical protein